MKALFVIDMLEDFFREGPLHDLRGKLVRNINLLIDQARSAEIPIVWVRQEFEEDLADAFLAMKKHDIKITIAGTYGSQILGELNKEAVDNEIVKKRYSAFYGTALDALLSQLNVTELILAGVNTHACIRMTAIDAYQRDFEVTIPRACVASNDVEHHEMTLQYLNREIASVQSLEEVFLDK